MQIALPDQSNSSAVVIPSSLSCQEFLTWRQKDQSLVCITLPETLLSVHAQLPALTQCNDHTAATSGTGVAATACLSLIDVGRSNLNPMHIHKLSMLQTRQDKTRQDKTRQDKTRQDKTRQDKTRHDKTRHDKTTQHTYNSNAHQDLSSSSGCLQSSCDSPRQAELHQISGRPSFWTWKQYLLPCLLWECQHSDLFDP